MATTIVPSGAMGRVVSLQDFIAAHPPHSANRTPSAPVPRAVGARSSKHTIRLHEKYQGLGIPKPDFIFTGVSEQGWGGKVIFVGLLGEGEDVELEEKGPFGSKQEAKERLSERALGELERLEGEGKVSRKPKEKRPKAAGGGGEVKPVEKKEKEPGINYVGQLLEFQRSTNSPQPMYMDYQLGNSFSCEATIEGHPTSFGSKETFFSSKKAARQDAARCAVEHFKFAGLWPDTFSDVGGIKKKKPAPSTSTPTQSPKVRSPSNASINADSAEGGSYAQRIATLASQLSLPTPLWSFSSSSAPGFHTVSCYFKNSHPHEGPIGEVRHIFGKKKAKEECARLTYQYLMGVKERRMQYGKSMEGVVGGAEVAEVAVKGPIGGDGGIEGAVLERKGEMDVDGGLDEFEDAVEEMAV